MLWLEIDLNCRRSDCDMLVLVLYDKIIYIVCSLFSVEKMLLGREVIMFEEKFLW